MADTGDAVAAAAYALTVWLAAAEAVTGLPDQAGTGWVSGGWATSAAPGNVAALNVVTDAHEGVRRMEAGLRAAVAGVAWQVRRGGSAGNTAAAIEAVVSLAAGADEGVRAEVAARLDRWTLEARVLPGVDGPPVWTVIRLRGRVVPPCPWCGTPNLRVNRGLGVVACLFPRCPGAGGVRPVAARAARGRGGCGRWRCWAPTRGAGCAGRGRGGWCSRGWTRSRRRGWWQPGRGCRRRAGGCGPRRGGGSGRLADRERDLPAADPPG